MVLSRAYKVKGSSIVESVVAMVIIAVCLSITMVVYVRVLDSQRSIASYEAEQRVKQLLFETKNEKQFVSEDYSFSSFRILKNVERISENENIYKIEFLVSEGKTSTKYQFIVAGQ